MQPASPSVKDNPFQRIHLNVTLQGKNIPCAAGSPNRDVSETVAEVDEKEGAHFDFSVPTSETVMYRYQLAHVLRTKADDGFSGAQSSCHISCTSVLFTKPIDANGELR